MVTSEYVELPLDGLSILTLVSKWMGPASDWHRYFAETSVRGYNMIHWTPLQERGESDSPYSIRNQLVYEPSMFPDKSVGSDGGKAYLQEVLKVAKEEYGLLSLIDVVLNHTANDSPWLLDHPEAGERDQTVLCLYFSLLSFPMGTLGYSPANTPHLTPALEIDTAMLEFSGILQSVGLPTTVNSEQDVAQLISGFEDYLKKRDMWQYYVLDVKKERAAVVQAFDTQDVTPWSGVDVANKTVVELAEILRSSGLITGYRKFEKRFCAHVPGPIAAGLVKAAFVNLEGSSDAMADAWIRVVDVLNVPLYEEWSDDTKAALEQMRNRLKYTRLDEHGPKLGPITPE